MEYVVLTVVAVGFGSAAVKELVRRRKLARMREEFAVDTILLRRSVTVRRTELAGYLPSWLPGENGFELLVTSHSIEIRGPGAINSWLFSGADVEIERFPSKSSLFKGKEWIRIGSRDSVERRSVWVAPTSGAFDDAWEALLTAGATVKSP